MALSRTPPSQRVSQRVNKGQPSAFLVNEFDLGENWVDQESEFGTPNQSADTAAEVDTVVEPPAGADDVNMSTNPEVERLLEKVDILSNLVEGLRAMADRERAQRLELEESVKNLRAGSSSHSDPVCTTAAEVHSQEDSAHAGATSATTIPSAPCSWSTASSTQSQFQLPTFTSTTCPMNAYPRYQMPQGSSTSSNMPPMVSSTAVPSSSSMSMPRGSSSTHLPPGSFPFFHYSQVPSQSALPAGAHQIGHRPKLYDLPSFSGRPEEWPRFVGNFRMSTESYGYNNLENSMRLQKSLSGPALESVESLLIYPDNVETILRTLEMRFGRPEELVRSQLKKAQSLPTISANNIQQLIPFSTVVQNLCAFLNTPSTQQYLANPMLLDELVAKLPVNQQMDWARQAMTFYPYPTLMQFSTWMNSVATIVGRCPTAASTHNPVQQTAARNHSNYGRPQQNRQDSSQSTNPNRVLHSSNDSPPPCNICAKPGHQVDTCDAFLQKSTNERWNIVKEARLCFSCLRKGHSCELCRQRRRCDTDGCNRAHHPLLHENQQRRMQPAATSLPSFVNPFASKDSANSATTETNHSSSHLLSCQPPTNEQQLLFRVVPVKLIAENRSIDTFALLDEGSSVTMVDEQIAMDLGLNGKRDVLHLQWFGSKQTSEPSSTVDIEIQGVGRSHKRFKLFNVRTVKNINLPAQTVCFSELHSKFQHIPDLPASDYVNARPKILIGLDNCHLGIPHERSDAPTNAPIAVNTKLGWIVYGPNKPTEFVGHQQAIVLHSQEIHSSLDAIHDLVKDYFTTENFGIKISDRRLESDSRQMAISRLMSIERKMSRDEEYAARYNAKIQDYLVKGYARRLSKEEAADEPAKTWYLPHFSVHNPNKPNKFRIVFDAAATVNGISLNSALLTGPDHLRPLGHILFRFRLGIVGVCADIKEMFCQVQIQPSDRPSQRFLWRGGDASKPMDTYEMIAMTFGATCSPCIANYVKEKNALDHQISDPVAARAIIDQHYVDDMVISFSSPNEAIQVSEYIRERFWIPHLRSLVQRVKSKCSFCKVRNAIPRPPLMGALPIDRLTPFVRQFTNTGLDYFGPFHVTVGRGREKRWAAIFTCLSVRAVHIELAADLSTDACIICIRNFCNIRGMPTRLRSDNATNFIGANRELKNNVELFDQNIIRAELSAKGIEWLFNCPANPEAGGAWERLVKSIKNVLSVTLKEVAPKVETLRSLLFEAANIVNARPLTHLPVDSEDQEPLTPNYFLLGSTSSTQVPGPIDSSALSMRKQWRIAQQLKDQFWRRWTLEYLPNLTRRTKWNEHTKPLEIGDLVIICDEAMPRSQWTRGRVAEIVKGKDNRIRSATVKTVPGFLRRPASKLAVLDVSESPASALP